MSAPINTASDLQTLLGPPPARPLVPPARPRALRTRRRSYEALARGFRSRPFLVSIAASAAAFFFWYARCPTFDFPAAAPFSGPVLYSPYTDPSAHWLKMNLHAHARAWGGATNGRASASATLSRYRAMGYGVAAVSNYQEAGAGAGPNDLSVYEQGYSVNKAHILVVGSRTVDWLDYPLLQGSNEKQDRIDRLRSGGAVIILAHPELRGGFSDKSLRQLTGYDAIEVMSHFGHAEREWDAALGAGRLAWAVANDDTHNSDDPRQTGRDWTMINARSAAPQDVLEALRAGRTYAVESVVGEGRQDVYLRRLDVTGDTIRVSTSGRRGTITFVGRDGRRLFEAANASSARFTLPADEPYARVVVQSPTTRLLLNPVVRSSGGRPPVLAATVATPRSVALAATAWPFIAAK